MGIYSKKASEYFKQGYNCAQAVFLAFAPLYNIDEITALKLASSFGGGMGKLREVCGAVSAMFAVAGLEKGYTSPNDDNSKGEHYLRIQKLAEIFKSEFGSIICRELLDLPQGSSAPTPTPRSENFYKERPCAKFIEHASEILEKEILE